MAVVRNFTLVSRWRLPAGADDVWDVLADPAFTWPDWWPALTALEVRAGGGRTALPWSSVRVRVRSPLGWALRVGLLLESATEPGPRTPGRARLAVSGDLVGAADVVVSTGSTSGGGPLAGGGPTPGDRTDVTLTWAVALARADAVGRLLRAAPRPLLTAAHAAVMRDGERGLAARLARTPAGPRG